MVERSRPWSGTVLGDSGPYTDDQWTNVWLAPAPVIATQGVFIDQLNDLDLSGVAATPVDINTGRALVNGIWYENDASLAVAIPDAVVNPRVDRIVLRADWALQTVRLTRLAGAEAAAPVPLALTQVDGVTWELPLWQVHVAVGPASVLTFYRDERSFIGQYVPTGVTDQRVYIESEFYLPDTAMGNNDRFDNWEVEVVGTSVLNPLDLAGFGAGAATFRYVGGGPGGTVNIRNRNHRPDDINAHLIIRAKSPNTDANLDRIMGFQDSAISLTPTNGVFWRADAAGNWFAVTRSAGVEAGSAIDTGQALDDVWRKFETRQVSTNVVTFLIDDVVVVTNRINIPAANLFLRAGIFDDGGAPAVNDYLDVDRLTLRGDR